MSSVPVTSDTVMEKTAETAMNTNVCSERPRPSKSQDEWTSAVFPSVAVAQRKSVASGDHNLLVMVLFDACVWLRLTPVVKQKIRR